MTQPSFSLLAVLDKEALLYLPAIGAPRSWECSGSSF